MLCILCWDIAIYIPMFLQIINYYHMKNSLIFFYCFNFLLVYICSTQWLYPKYFKKCKIKDRQLETGRCILGKWKETRMMRVGVETKIINMYYVHVVYFFILNFYHKVLLQFESFTHFHTEEMCTMTSWYVNCSVKIWIHAAK